MTKHIAHQLIDCVRGVSTLSTLPILITDQPNGSQVCMNESSISAPHPTATRRTAHGTLYGDGECSEDLGGKWGGGGDGGAP